MCTARIVFIVGIAIHEQGLERGHDLVQVNYRFLKDSRHLMRMNCTEEMEDS